MAIKNPSKMSKADQKVAEKPRFVMLGKGSRVHTVFNEKHDRKYAQCLTVRKFTVAGKVPAGTMSPEAALTLDNCTNCKTHDAAQRLIDRSKSAEDRRAEADDRRNQTLAKAKGETKTKKGKSKVKADKPKKESKPKAAKAGVRSTSGGTQGKAEQLATFAKEHGWQASVTDADPGLLVTAVRDDETIRCYFVDGKYDTARHASVSVDGWSGKLRGVHGCRNQMALEGRDRPHPQPGAGRSRARKVKDEESTVPDKESPEDARKRVPFSIDDPEIEIIDAIKGRTIRWRNGTSNSVMEARVPSNSKRTRIIEHPKTKRRMLGFLEVVEVGSEGEQVGPERTVYLDKIMRVMD